ncbi:MAG: NAD(P)/FAD-dependent oxidoreductase [Candidatus Acidiferrales bacterium]
MGNGILIGKTKGVAVQISGAGPSGLAAAITIANRGGQAIVHEHNQDVGLRFHGDFQGLENWTSDGDVLEELCRIGIEGAFDHTPFREMVIYDPEGREYIFRSSEPLFYLVRRGPASGMLDAGLKNQAIECGVEIRFQDACHHLPEGGIVAQGPRGSDAIAVGYTFETDMADGAFGAVSDQLAPKGYSYLLVHKGIGTIASGIFEDYHNDKKYLQATVDFFQKKTGVKMRNSRHFGGTGNFLVPRTARKGNILLVGEAAGFQDALWGFGMRYAMLSGHLAARALLEGRAEEYDQLWKEQFGGTLRAGIVNRYTFEKLGNFGYAKLLRLLDRGGNVRNWLHTHYGMTFWKRLTYPIAHHVVRSNRKEAACVMEGCDCTWCRCQHGSTEQTDSRLGASA